MLQAIDYHLPSNCFELMTYKNKILKVPATELKVRNSSVKPRIVHEIEAEGASFKIEGYG